MRNSYEFTVKEKFLLTVMNFVMFFLKVLCTDCYG